MRTKDLKAWLKGTEQEEKSVEESEEGHEGAGNIWHLFVWLLQHAWDTGEIPQQLAADSPVRGGVNPKRGQRLQLDWTPQCTCTKK